MKTLVELFAIFEDLKDMDLSTTKFVNATKGMVNEQSFGSNLDNRCMEYLMCRSGFYKSTAIRVLPKCMGQDGIWKNFVANAPEGYKSPPDCKRVMAIKYALLTSGLTEIAISNLGHPFKALKQTA